MPYEDWIRKQEAKFEALGYDLYRIVRPQDGELSEGDDWPFSIRPFAALRPETWGDIVPSSTGTVSRKDSIYSRLGDIETAIDELQSLTEIEKWANYVAPGEAFHHLLTPFTAAGNAYAAAAILTASTAGKKARLIGLTILGDMSVVLLKTTDAAPVTVLDVAEMYKSNGVLHVLLDHQCSDVDTDITFEGTAVLAAGKLAVIAYYTMEA